MTLTQWVGPETWRAELPHSVRQHTLIWITRGQGRCQIEGVRRGLGVHNAICLPAGTQFSLDLGKQGFGIVCLVPPGGTLLMPDTPRLLRIRDVKAQTELTAIIEAMQREQNSERPFWDEAMDAHAGLLTVWLRRAIINHEDALEKATAAQRLVSAYASLVERDYTSGKQMSDYARMLGVTPTHLTRTCKTCAGQTASDLLTQRVLHAARDLLQNTDYPANQVAAMLGFTSAAYFSRFILHHTGYTPSSLRKQKPVPANGAAAAR